MRPFFIAILSALLLVAQTAYAAAEKRVALVLGLSAYREVPALLNPRNDAADVAGKLKGLGFEVVEGYDLEHEGLMRKIRDFSSAMTGADVAMFYYSGHGIQVNGVNYLAPVDTKLESAADMDFELVKLDFITDQMQNAQAEKKLKVGLVFLDACRNNPLARNLKSSSRAVGAGLAKVQEAPSGMLIAFSTQPGNVALDGIGRNSPFTKAVLKNIDKAGMSVGDMLINVRTEVMQETAEKQVPWENSSLTGQFYFNPAAAETVKVAKVESEERVDAPAPVRDSKQVLTVDDSTLDLKFWESISNSTNPALFEAYVRKFPNGNFVDLAKVMLDELISKRAIAVEEAKKPVQVPQPTQDEQPAQVEVQPQTEQPAQAAAQVEQPQQQAEEVQASPAQQQKPTQVASLGEQAATDEAANVPAAGSAAAAALLQRQLQRVGCYNGQIDGDWGNGSLRAMQRLNNALDTDHSATVPSIETINALRQINTQVCVQVEKPQKVQKVKIVRQEPQTRAVVRCGRGEIRKGGECVVVQKRKKIRQQPAVEQEQVEFEQEPRVQVQIQRRQSIGVPIPFGIGIGF